MCVLVLQNVQRYKISLLQVWSLSIDVHVLDHGGNLADACMLCTLAALMAFRRPDTEVAAGGADSGRARVTVLSPSVREPVPLSLHHLPLGISFAFFEVRTNSNIVFH